MNQIGYVTGRSDRHWRPLGAALGEFPASVVRRPTKNVPVSVGSTAIEEIQSLHRKVIRQEAPLGSRQSTGDSTPGAETPPKMIWDSWIDDEE